MDKLGNHFYDTITADHDHDSEYDVVGHGHSQYLPEAGGTMSGVLYMSTTSKITGLPDSSNNDDIVHYGEFGSGAGYQDLPSGLRIAWGTIGAFAFTSDSPTVGSKSVTFSPSMSVCYTVSILPAETGTGQGGSECLFGLSVVGPTGFTVKYMRHDDDFAVGPFRNNFSINWMAIGKG